MINKKNIASIEALKIIYYVIVGLALTQIMSIFTVPNAYDKVLAFILALSLLPTLVRFSLGITQVLEAHKTSASGTTLLVDFFLFLFMGSFLYFMAAYIGDIKIYLIFFIILLLVDLLWLRITKTAVPRQFIFSDISVIVLLFVLYGASYLAPSSGFWALGVFLLLISVIATCCDFKYNWKFYFNK